MYIVHLQRWLDYYTVSKDGAKTENTRIYVRIYSVDIGECVELNTDEEESNQLSVYLH